MSDFILTISTSWINFSQTVCINVVCRPIKKPFASLINHVVFVNSVEKKRDVIINILINQSPGKMHNGNHVITIFAFSISN